MLCGAGAENSVSCCVHSRARRRETKRTSLEVSLRLVGTASFLASPQLPASRQRAAATWCGLLVAPAQFGPVHQQQRASVTMVSASSSSVARMLHGRAATVAPGRCRLRSWRLPGLSDRFQCVLGSPPGRGKAPSGGLRAGGRRRRPASASASACSLPLKEAALSLSQGFGSGP